MMVTGSKSPSSSFSSPSPFTSPSTSPSSFVTPSKGDESKNKNDDALEREFSRETVLYDTIIHMHTPPSHLSTMSESEKAQINKIREVKNYLKENM
eukprot:3240115-Ditylum_brightwellii.AAC.1